ncbi:MAG: DJ-1/PfpI family protein [Bacteroidales bacterium]|nr:DJ-1/PfpI family protein [Bacteroidales bacterium]
MMHARAFIFLAEGFEEIEAIAPADILRRSTRQVYLVSISESLAVTSAHQITVQADMNWEEFISHHADALAENREKTALVFPGGLPGAENLANHKTLMSLAGEHFRAQGIVCAICAAPGTILPRLEGCDIQNRKFTCYPGFEENPLSQGAVYTGESCCRDGHLITANGPGSAMEFGYCIAAALTTESAIAVLKNGMMYRE